MRLEFVGLHIEHGQIPGDAKAPQPLPAPVLPGGDPARELVTAIRTRQTWVSKGMILQYEKEKYGQDESGKEKEGWRFSLTDVKKPGFQAGKKWILSLKSAAGTKEYEFDGPELFIRPEEMPEGDVCIPKLYRDNTEIENLVCVAPVMR